MNRPLIALAFACAAAVAGCGDDPAAPTDAAPVMDLTPGNTWHYALRENEPGAPVVAASRTVTGTREITWNGRTISVAVEVPTVAPAKFVTSTGRLLRNERDGLYTYGTVDSDGTVHAGGRALVAPRDGRPGERYDVGGGRVLLCVAADSTVATDFGEVVADVYVLVLYEGTIRVPDVYVVPGVGPTRYWNDQWTAWVTGYAFE